MALICAHPHRGIRPSDLYQEAMLTNYDDPPEIGEKILGETLYFNGSLFSEKELAAGPQPGLSFAASTGSSSSGCCWIRQVPEHPSYERGR
ncbi:hypothetical protein CRV24_002482 [Beauveria bassiana]|nr:hypothetical protein CRV24_002482 [Beauveria bassiana]KAH8717849.1 hypothetical protein HC256_002525 [Beauveria bassiana]